MCYAHVCVFKPSLLSPLQGAEPSIDEGEGDGLEEEEAEEADEEGMEDEDDDDPVSNG